MNELIEKEIKMGEILINDVEFVIKFAVEGVLDRDQDDEFLVDNVSGHVHRGRLRQWCFGVPFRVLCGNA